MTFRNGWGRNAGLVAPEALLALNHLESNGVRRQHGVAVP
jgi:hypothetical protein